MLGGGSMEFETTNDMKDFINWCILNNYIQFVAIDGEINGDLYVTEKGEYDSPEYIYQDYLHDNGLYENAPSITP